MRTISRTLTAVLLALASLAAGTANAQGPAWHATLDSARRVAAESNRLVLIVFHADWCQACRVMERDTLGQQAVLDNLQANYALVKINADQLPRTAKEYGVAALPTTVVTTPDGQMLDRIQGRVEASPYVSRLAQVAANARRPATAPLAQVPVAPTAPAAATAPPGPPMAYTPPAYAPPAYNPPAPTAPAVPAVPPTYAPPAYAPPASPAMVAAAPPAYAPPAYAPPASPAVPPPAAPPAAPPPVAASPAVPPQPAAPPTAVQPPAGNPPFGLEGFCPVTLSEQRKWVAGDRRWGLVHRGRTYLFAGPAERDRFDADPDAFAPMFSGNDIVSAVEQGQSVSGRREHGVFFGKHIYLFSDEATLRRFEQNPAAYADQALQALRAGAYPTTQWR
jgi:protein disulfide-isomerase